MQLCERDGVRFFTFTSFPNGELTHAVFGRAGGVSPAPFDSLNMSISAGDSLENVRENRRRALAAAGGNELTSRSAGSCRGLVHCYQCGR